MTFDRGIFTMAVSPQKVESGSWIYSRDYECMVPKAQHLANQHNFYNDKRADFPCPAIRPDGLPHDVKSMADGRVYDGRSAYYASVKRAGCHIVGDMDPSSYVAKPPSERDVERDIVMDVKKAWEIEQSKVPSYGPEARRLMRKQRRKERMAKV